MIAQSKRLAKQYGSEPGGIHFLMSIRKEPASLSKHVLDEMGIDIDRLDQVIEAVLREGAVQTVASGTLDTVVERAIESPDARRQRFVSDLHLMLATLELGEPSTRLVFEHVGVALEAAVERTRALIRWCELNERGPAKALPQNLLDKLGKPGESRLADWFFGSPLVTKHTKSVIEPSPPPFEFGLEAHVGRLGAGGFVARVPKGITNPSDLFRELRASLLLPNYFGENWDDLDECLRDFHWIRERKIIILHEDYLQGMRIAELALYVCVLGRSLLSWQSYQVHELSVDLHEVQLHELIVSFPEAAKDLVASVWGWLCQCRSRDGA